jgi:hypothetical protein
MKFKVEQEPKKYISISQAQEMKASSLWVVNTSEQVNDSGKGDVVFTVPVGDQLVSILVQKTWLPRNLANQAPRKAILEGVNFLRAVQIGAIKLITEEYATKLLDSEDADAEEQELRAKEAVIRTATKAKGVTIEEVVDLDKEASVRSVDMADIGNDVPASFKVFATRLNEMEEKKAVNELRSHGTLNEQKAKYLIANLTNHPKITAFLKKQLADE